GLPLARALMEAHGGSLRAEAPAGRHDLLLRAWWPAGSRAPLRREVEAVVHPHWKAQAAGQPAVQEGGAHVAASQVPSSGAISLLACVPRKGRRTALLLDSDPRMVRYLRANLEARGFRPVIATSAPEALRLIELEEPDLVLLDVAGGRGEVDGLV